MSAVLQRHLPFAPWMDPRTLRLPGMLPVEGDDWLRIDEAFAGQMAERDRLIATTPGLVQALLPRGRAAADELIETVLARLAATGAYAAEGGALRRPDGVAVALDPGQPLLTLGRLVQEDLCLLEAEGPEHVLTGAILCFPAGWTLSEKLGRPLTRIHHPVAAYDDGIAARVQRLFDAIRPERPMWRANALLYDDPALFQPRREGQPRPKPTANAYVRSERQCLVRLPRTRAVVFSIHTYLLAAGHIAPGALAALHALRH
jgi:hypothetical protein